VPEAFSLVLEVSQVVFLPQVFDVNNRFAHGKNITPLKGYMLRRGWLRVNQKPFFGPGEAAGCSRAVAGGAPVKAVS
jgi:hypothetical protein